MPRPIDANKLENMLRNFIGRTIPGSIEQDAYSNILYLVEQLPSLDGDYIVRCKECANQRKYGDMTVCLITSKVVLPNFYCNFGTKK